MRSPILGKELLLTMSGVNETEPPVLESAPPRPPGLGDLGSRTYFVSVSLQPVSPDDSEGDLVQITRHYAVKGVLFTLAGVIAILFPLIFGLAVEQLLAWILVLGGSVTLVQFLLVCGSPATFSLLLLGALHFAVGLWLLLRPIQGLAALTLVLCAWFICHGILKLVLACQVRNLSVWPAILLSGIISIGLGVAIFALTPKYGLRLLGIVFGVDLLATGVAMLVISLMACIYKGRPRPVSDAETAREPLLNGSGHVAAPSA